MKKEQMWKKENFLGHENMGEVVEIGNAVIQIKVDDMICTTINIGCGHCQNFETGLTGYEPWVCRSSGIWLCRNGTV